MQSEKAQREERMAKMEAIRRWDFHRWTIYDIEIDFETSRVKGLTSV